MLRRGREELLDVGFPGKVDELPSLPDQGPDPLLEVGPRLVDNLLAPLVIRAEPGTSLDPTVRPDQIGVPYGEEPGVIRLRHHRNLGPVPEKIRNVRHDEVGERPPSGEVRSHDRLVRSRDRGAQRREVRDRGTMVGRQGSRDQYRQHDAEDQVLSHRVSPLPRKAGTVKSELLER